MGLSRFLGWGHLNCMAKELAVLVLDLVGMPAGERAGSAIARSVRLAQHVRPLGYRIVSGWQNPTSIAGLACSATAVLIGHVAAATKTDPRRQRRDHAALIAPTFGGGENSLGRWKQFIRRVVVGLGRAPGGDFASHAGAAPRPEPER